MLMNDLVAVQVPADIAGEVRRFAAFVLAERGDGFATHEPSFDGIPDYPIWTDAQVTSFATNGTVTSRIYRRIMDSVIDQDAVGRWVSIADIAQWTDQPASVISTFRTHLYRYINAHLPEGTRAPFTRANGQDLRPTRGREVYYRVSQECANQWQRIKPQIGEL